MAKRSGHIPARLSGLLPRHSSAPAAPPPVIQQEAPYERALKVQIVSWNMNDTLPKGDLAALLGVVPPYAADGKSEFQLDDTGHPYHIIVVAGQECPTGLLPMGMGAVKMERSKEHKSKSKPKDDDSPSKPKRPRRSEEDEYQQLEPSTPIQQQHSSGWSALLEDWYCKGLGAKRFSLEDWTAMGIPPSPTPSRSPSLPALGLPPAISDPAKLSVPPSPRRMNTWMPTESVGPYVLVAKERLMGIYLAVFVHKETRSLVRGCSKSSVTAGLIGGRLGNKGGVGISLNIAGTSFLFVNAHLAAHEGRQAMRLENMEKIQAELKLDHFGEPVHPRKEPESKPDLTDSFDYTFIFGDLNFRLNVSRLHADWLISRHNYHQAQEFDELRANMRSGTIFPGFEEPPISFPPTFKYDVPKSRHHSRREKDHPRRVGVRVSIRRSRKRRKSKGKIKDVEDPKLEPVNEGETEPILQQTEASSEEDESDQDQESVSAFSAARPSGSTHRPPSTRSHRSGVLSSREPESDSCEEEGSLQHNTQLNAAAPPRSAVLKLISRSAKQSWRSIVAKSTSSLGAIPIRSPPGSPTRATLEGRIGRTSPKFGRTSPSGKSGRTSPSNRFVASPTSGRFEAIPTPKFRSTSPISKSGRASPSRKSGRASPTSKSGRASPAPKSGRASPPKFGRTSPMHKYAGTHLGLGPSPNMGRSQPNLVIDTGIDGDVPTRVRASVDGGSRSVPNVDAGGKVSGLFPGELKSGLVRTSGEFTKSNGDPVKPNGELKANGEVKGLGVTGVGGTLAPPALIRHNSSVGSAAEAGTAPEDSSSDSEVKGVYDTSSKQRVPSWCDRIVYKSTVLPPQPPPSLPVPNLPGPLSDSFHDDGPFGRVGHIFSKIQRRGSRGRKDSLTPSTRAGSIPTRSKEPSTSSGYGRTREALLSESRPSPFLKHPDGEDDSAIVITHGPSSRPGSSGRGGKRSGRPGSSGSTGKRPGSSGSGAEPASLHWPRTNPFARLLHPHLHTPGGPGLIHAVSMEPVPQPSVNTSPRPRSFSTSEGREKTRESMEVPVQPSEDGGFWRFFRQLTRDTPIVAEPEPEPEPVEVPEERKRGDIVCLSYGTLDDKEMQRLGGKSDHRPVIGTYSVYI